MRFAIPREREIGEARVAAVPDTVRQLIKKGHQIFVEKGAGALAFISDQEFQAAGAQIAPDEKTLFQNADCILKVQPPTAEELELFREGQALVSFLWHLRNRELLLKFAHRKITAFSMDAIPRITRAQSMDALSSMATIAGYKAALLAAAHLPKFFPMLTTAAGTIRPAQGLIIGAGVAGLQAIATARRLGAVVEAFDTRPAVKEQVLSLGATFVDLGAHAAQDKYGYAKEASQDELAHQQKMLHERLKLADFVITTAQIPGKPAPRLILRNMLADMKPGSVIIDLAAESGGNCELTSAGETVVENNIAIAGPLNLASTMPLDASRMYARNQLALLAELTSDKGFTFDWANEVVKETCVTHNGEVRKP